MNFDRKMEVDEEPGILEEVERERRKHTRGFGMSELNSRLGF